MPKTNIIDIRTRQATRLAKVTHIASIDPDIQPVVDKLWPQTAEQALRAAGLLQPFNPNI